jgi:D-alanine transaminase|tara:strand:+ start:7058 stop:7906 length:849 start_codon:yes stop_codon:yes gene_type:complete
MGWTFLNDSFIRKEEVKISPFDRGFLFGDGVYEVIPSYNGKMFLYEKHLSRLERSLQETKINKPKELKNLLEILESIIVRNSHPNQALYIQITRGQEEERNHSVLEHTTPTLFISSSQIKENPYLIKPNKEGLKVSLQEENRWSRRDIKSINLLPNVMALKDDKIDEVIFHEEDCINEGAKSNIFCAFGEVVVTPPSNGRLLEGVTRAFLINLLKEKGIKILEEEIKLDRLLEADEIWLTSSIKQIQPISSIEKTNYFKDSSKDSLWFKSLNYYSSELKINN